MTPLEVNHFRVSGTPASQVLEVAAPHDLVEKVKELLRRSSMNYSRSDVSGTIVFAVSLQPGSDSDEVITTHVIETLKEMGIREEGVNVTETQALVESHMRPFQRSKQMRFFSFLDRMIRVHSLRVRVVPRTRAPSANNTTLRVHSLRVRVVPRTRAPSANNTTLCVQVSLPPPPKRSPQPPKRAPLIENPQIPPIVVQADTIQLQQILEFLGAQRIAVQLLQREFLWECAIYSSLEWVKEALQQIAPLRPPRAPIQHSLSPGPLFQEQMQVQPVMPTLKAFHEAIATQNYTQAWRIISRLPVDECLMFSTEETQEIVDQLFATLKLFYSQPLSNKEGATEMICAVFRFLLDPASIENTSKKICAAMFTEKWAQARMLLAFARYSAHTQMCDDQGLFKTTFQNAVGSVFFFNTDPKSVVDIVRTESARVQEKFTELLQQAQIQFEKEPLIAAMIQSWLETLRDIKEPPSVVENPEALFTLLPISECDISPSFIRVSSPVEQTLQFEVVGKKHARLWTQHFKQIGLGSQVIVTRDFTGSTPRSYSLECVVPIVVSPESLEASLAPHIRQFRSMDECNA